MNMNATLEPDTEKTVERQRAFFNTGATLPLSFRIGALKKLQREIRSRKSDIDRALREDLGRATFENYMVETGLVLEELKSTIRKLPRWIRDKSAAIPLAAFPGRGTIHCEPLGTCLIMSPWNYPFQLSMMPLIGAIAAGNCAVIKPSAYAGATAEIIGDIVSACYNRDYITVVKGGRQENAALLEQRFDFIFFTGSTEVGKLVMEKASANLTPLCLELGGKSPVIVDETADITVAARRIVFGKFLNAGQTCVAPDYLFAHESISDHLLSEMKKNITAMFGNNPLESKEYPKIINQKHFDRLKGLLTDEEIYTGGENDNISRISPTILSNVNPQSPVMQEEIFGPILPVMTFANINQPVGFVKNREKPLALYLFTRDRNTEKRIVSELSFGGGCINDTVMHLSAAKLPFGGVGASGMGSYHGHESYQTFSHKKSILKRRNHPDIPLRYHPYTKPKEWVLGKYWR